MEYFENRLRCARQAEARREGLLAPTLSRAGATHRVRLDEEGVDGRGRGDWV